MEQFTRITGIAAPLLHADIDTDQIIPGPEILWSNEDTHERWGAGLFANWRYVGERQPNPDFVLNQPPYNRARILLAGRNFGCGSSRENAPKALRGFGFRAILAPSYGDIFFSNCFRNGLLPVMLDIESIHKASELIGHSPETAPITVDLQNECVSGPSGFKRRFETPSVLRAMLLEGKDEIDLTLEKKVLISNYRGIDRQRRPWAY